LKSLQVLVSKPTEDTPLGFAEEDGSIIDGENAHR
jgi:hypothetical protein